MSDANAVNAPFELALAQYFEPLLRRRAALLVADPDSSLAVRLLAQDLELEVITPQEAAEGLPWQDGTFDVALAVDAQSWAPSLAEGVAELRRLVDRRGVVALVAQPPPSRGRRRNRRRSPPPAHAALGRALSDSFAHVSVLQQSPFAGYLLADVEAEGDSGLAVDRGMGGVAVPAAFVGLASDRPLRIESELLVQLPEAGAAAEAADPGELDKLREQNAELSRRETELRDELKAQRRAAGDAERELKALAASGGKVGRLEKALAEAERDLDRALDRVDTLRDGERELHALSKQRLEMQRERDAARRKLDDAVADRDAATKSARAAEDEVADLERRVQERGKRVGELEQDIKRRGVAERDLLEELRRAQAGSAAAGAELSAAEAPDTEPPAAADDDNTLRGEVQGLRLRLAEAEQALEHAAGSSAPSAAGASDGVADTEAQERIRALEAELAEADRAAETYSAHEDQTSELERQLVVAQQRAQGAEDQCRSLEQDLAEARSTAEGSRTEGNARLELAQGQLREAIQERDDARRGLQEARSLLAQLAEKVDADLDDPQTLVDSVAPAAPMGGLQAELQEKQDLLEELTRELEERNQRIQQLEMSAPPPGMIMPRNGDQLTLAESRLNVAEQQAEAFRQLCLRSRDVLTAVRSGREANDLETLLERLDDLA